MRPPPFHLVRPRTLEEALEARAAWGPRAQVLAGGQSLLPDLNAGRVAPDAVIDLKGVDGLGAIRLTGEGLTMGALVTHEDVVRFGAAGLPHGLPHSLPHSLGRGLGRLPAVARAVAPRPVRVRGTVVGNVVAAFRGAAWPALLGAYGASVELRSAGGRTVRRDVRDAAGLAADGWLATEVRVPAGRHVGWAEAQVRTAGRTYRVACGMSARDDGGRAVWLSGLSPVVRRHDLTGVTDQELEDCARRETADLDLPTLSGSRAAQEREEELQLWQAVVGTVLRRARNDLEGESR